MRYKLVSEFHDDQDPLTKKLSQYGFYAEKLELPPRTPLGGAFSKLSSDASHEQPTQTSHGSSTLVESPRWNGGVSR